VGIDPVVLSLAAVNGFHSQGMAKHERDALRRAHVREPVPREHAFRRHDQIAPVGGDDLEEHLRRRFHVPMHDHLAGGVKDADVHGLDVEIDPAIVAMLTVVESHSVLLLRGFAHLPCVKPTGGR
jgi:hypothetical protein